MGFRLPSLPIMSDSDLNPHLEGNKNIQISLAGTNKVIM